MGENEKGYVNDNESTDTRDEISVMGREHDS